MSISQTVIDTLDNPPLPTDTPENFNNKAFAMAAIFAPMCEQLNETAAAMDLNDTSSVSGTTLTIGTGSKTLTVDANKSYQIGMTVKIAETLDGTKWMAGDVTAYNSTTGSLTVVVTKVSGSGTANAWTISLSALETLSDSSVTVDKLADGALPATTQGRAKMADGFTTLAKLDRTGADGQIMTSQGTGLPPIWRDKFGNSAVVATTSGAAIDVTGIPSWAKRLTLLIDDVSTSGTSPLLIQGGAGSIETTSYNSTGSAIQGTTCGATGATSGFQLSNTDGGSTWVRRGVVELFNKPGTNTWELKSMLSVTGAPNDRADFGAGKKTFSGVLDSIRLTTLGGTDTFDAGSITVMWE